MTDDINGDEFINFEERADHLTESDLENVTAKSDFFNNIHRALVARGIKLIVGPRGSGKTHLMRYTWVECKNNQTKPLCLYISFNRYLRLEPFLKTKSDAIELFHVWVLTRILLSVVDLIKALSKESDWEKLFEQLIGMDEGSISSAISKLERGIPSELLLEKDVSISKTVEVINKTAEFYGRKRSIVLFDDAALTLTPEYMQELFEIIRSIKCSTISPKASVYPGTTEYGPRFHVQHEADAVPVWLPVTNSDYSEVMGDIARNRDINLDTIPEDVVEFLKYASFGIPRAFLVMLRDFRKGGYSRSQQVINKIIQEHNKWRLSEYKSLAIKVPKFENIISVGETLLNQIVSELKEENTNNKLVQFEVGFSNLDNPMERRMIDLLVESGLLYEHTSVSHGEDREYHRYTPHFSLMMQKRVFTNKDRNATFSDVVERLKSKRARHPLRRTISKMLGDDTQKLKLNIFPCTQCETPRLNDSQKFCHNCGSALVDMSTFDHCMKINLNEIPTLTDWQKNKINGLGVDMIGAFLSMQDPGTELRKIEQIGSVRANTIINRIEDYVDEFLS